MKKESETRNMTEEDKEERGDIYFTVNRNGKRRVISKEAWEKEWLDWYNKNNR